jgi:tetratricopeptide (TPR) repeat protein
MFVPPRVYTPLDSKSYRLGTDPAMTTILTPDTSGSVIGRIQHDIEAGDSASAERALTAARENTANRFRSLEADVNRLGYEFVGSGRMPQAIQVFRLNTRAYPRSANTYDSLAETLLTAGYRDAAVATYRRALEVEPGFPPSTQALQRLGYCAELAPAAPRA